MNEKVIDPTALGLDVSRISGEEAYCVCPFHNDHTPSASFNVRSGLFFCYVCGCHPTMWEIAAELGGNVQKMNVEMLPTAKSGEEWEMDWKWVLSCRKAFDNEYLMSRGITNDVVNKFDVREFPKGIAFIIKNGKGVPVGAQVRVTKADARNRYLTMGEKTPIWPCNDLGTSGSNSILLVEGVFGVMNAWKRGYNNVFAIMGSQSVASAIPLIRGFRNKYVAFDNDLAGHVAAAKAVAIHTGIKAYMPGVEADEVDGGFFRKLFANELDTISYYKDVYPFTARPSEASRLVERFIYKQFKERKVR
jgi:hypothetical protein